MQQKMRKNINKKIDNNKKDKLLIFGDDENVKTKYIDGIKWTRDEEGTWWTANTNAYCLDCEEFADENGKHSCKPIKISSLPIIKRRRNE